MTITQFGRVEVDPNKVPIPASSGRGSEPSFEESLETVARQRADEPLAEPEATSDREMDADTPEEPPTTSATGGETSSEGEAPAALPRTPREPEEPSVAELRPIAGQGGASPSARTHDASRAAAMDHTPSISRELAAPEPRSAVPVQHATTAPQAHRPGQSQAQPTPIIERPSGPKALPKVASTQRSYRTLNKAAIQMAEAARDSVFRQIALRMNGEGGEMRVLLDPPELGKLDLHMVVEKGGTVHLSLMAERPELALILEKHLGQLKQTLEAHGLSIGNAEVRGREQQLQDREGRRDFPSSSDGMDEQEDWATAAFRRAGYITAEGLDFWV